jgi:hypothetical protein
MGKNVAQRLHARILHHVVGVGGVARDGARERMGVIEMGQRTVSVSATPEGWPSASSPAQRSRRPSMSISIGLSPAIPERRLRHSAIYSRERSKK